MKNKRSILCLTFNIIGVLFLCFYFSTEDYLLLAFANCFCISSVVVLLVLDDKDFKER